MSMPDHDHDRPHDESGCAWVHTDQAGVTLPASPIEREIDEPRAEMLGKAGQVPPLRADATAEEKELHWFRHVYQGDRMPQLTVRAVFMGGVLGMFMSISNLYTTLKLGWAFGVAITACVLSYVIWNALRAISGQRLTPMSILENNCMQSTASAAGYSTGGTIATAFGAVLLMTGQHTGWKVLVPYVFLTAALGVFLAIPMKRQMINIDQLAFPSGIAAAETLRSLHSRGREAIRKAYALVTALFTGSLVGLFRGPEGSLAILDRLYAAVFHIPDLLPFTGRLNPTAPTPMSGLGFEPGTLMIAAGAFMGVRVSLSMLAGSVLLYYVVAPHVLGDIPLRGGEYRPIMWALWGGTSLMVFSSLTSVAMQWRTLARAFNVLKASRGADGTPSPLTAIEVPSTWLFAGVVPIGIGMVVVGTIAFQMSIVLGVIAVAMSLVVSLVCCRATGETDTTPIGPMGKVTQLLYALLAKGNRTVNLMAAGMTSSAGGSAADLLTDLKSGYLLGANPRKQFLAQFCGIFFGTLAIVPAWYLMVPNKAALEAFNPPSTRMWFAMAEALASGLHSISLTARYAIVCGAIIGTALPLTASLRPKWGPYLPSAMGLGLAWVVPFQNSLSFAMGAVIAWIWLTAHKPTAERYTFPIAAGLVAGESIVLALIAMSATAVHLYWHS